MDFRSDGQLTARGLTFSILVPPKIDHITVLFITVSVAPDVVIPAGVIYDKSGYRTVVYTVPPCNIRRINIFKIVRIRRLVRTPVMQVTTFRLIGEISNLSIRNSHIIINNVSSLVGSTVMTKTLVGQKVSIFAVLKNLDGGTLRQKGLSC